MSRKFIKIFLIVTILYSLVYVISGCVEEPTIAPIKRPYSSVRIGNFAYNADTIDVAITYPDSSVTVKSNLMLNTLTDYFDLPSGKRRIVVTNSNNHQILLDKLIEFSSYEECSLFFVGYFSTSIDSGRGHTKEGIANSDHRSNHRNGESEVRNHCDGYLGHQALSKIERACYNSGGRSCFGAYMVCIDHKTEE